MVAAWSIDRIGRSLQQLVEFMEELKDQGVGLYLHQQNVDSSTAAGKAILSMCGVFAEFERSIIVERVNAGLARARAQGKTLGRRLQPLRYLHDCSDYFRLEHFAGWDLHPLESAAFARRTPSAAGRDGLLSGSDNTQAIR
jgi:hypothetical protein